MSVFPRYICMKVSIHVIFMLLLQPVAGQYDFSRLDQLLEKNKKSLGNELAVLVWKDSTIIYKKELAEFTVKTQAPVAASSQWLTAAAVLVLADEGKLKLNDPLNKFIPIYYNYMKHHIQLQHCLSNTTGMERETNFVSKFFEKKKFETLEEEVKALAVKEVNNGPGKEFFFGNYGMTIAGYACEKATKKTFDRVVQEKILRPLRMRGTSFSDPEGRSPNPASGAQSTANDYLNFLIMLLNNGIFEGKRILSENSVAAMQRSQINGLPVAFTPPAAAGYSFGYGSWIIEMDANGKGRVLTCPSFIGTWPVIDHCRKYAAVIILKNPQKDAKREFFDQFKSSIEEAIGDCVQQ